jgi:hypothetical protein
MVGDVQFVEIFILILICRRAESGGLKWEVAWAWLRNSSNKAKDKDVPPHNNTTT